MPSLAFPARGRRPGLRIGGLLLALVCCTATTLAPAATAPAARGTRGMVVSADAEASAVGVEVLRRGGNAADVAVAVAFALAVTYPEAGNLGGGGFALYRDPDGAYHAIDFRESAPEALTPALFRGADGRADRGLSQRGGLAVGVPGSVAGLAEIHGRWGNLPWGALIEPAIRLAREGFAVSRRLAHSLSMKADRLAADPAAAAIFLPGGRVPVEGERLVQPDLAATLERIAAEGPRGFYRGVVASALIATVKDGGGVMTTDDLAGYRPIERPPLTGSYRGHRVVSFPPPSSGGVALLQILAMLERYEPSDSGFGSSLTIHRMAEAERRAYADRSRWLGDPDFVDVPVEGLLRPDYLAARGRSIRDRRVTPSRRLAAGGPAPVESEDTTHFSIVDSRGGAMALTTTLNSSFGAAMVAPRTGVLLNNEIDDFSLAPGVPDQFGLVGGDANAVAGGKRPVSSMTPTIVECADDRGAVCLVLGSPGGSRIITSVLQVLINVVDHGMPLQQAVSAPRVHHQWLPDRLEYERWTLPDDVARRLRRRGHRLHAAGPMGNVSAIGRSPDGVWLGAADPRRGGRAMGYSP